MSCLCSPGGQAHERPEWSRGLSFLFRSQFLAQSRLFRDGAVAAPTGCPSGSSLNTPSIAVGSVFWNYWKERVLTRMSVADFAEPPAVDVFLSTPFLFLNLLPSSRSSFCSRWMVSSAAAAFSAAWSGFEVKFAYIWVLPASSSAPRRTQESLIASRSMDGDDLGASGLLTDAHAGTPSVRSDVFCSVLFCVPSATCV